jgi:hypothetical protein
MKTWLARARQGWMDVAASIGTFQARLLLTVLYFTWMAPFGLLVRFVNDPLALRETVRPSVPTGWKRRPAQDHTIQALRSQF